MSSRHVPTIVRPFRVPLDLPRAVRAALVLLLGALILLGPGYRQVLGLNSPWLRPWVMYSGFARNACDMGLYVDDLEGTVEVLDRFETLGRDAWYTQSRRRRRLRRKAVDGTILQVCRRLPDPDRLRARVRCGSRHSWEIVYTGEEKACSTAYRRLRDRR